MSLTKNLAGKDLFEDLVEGRDRGCYMSQHDGL